MLPHLTLVLGGAASGKSVFAEALAEQSGRAPVYLATAEARDTEMHHKIDRHRARRGPQWRTIEAPGDIAPALGKVAQDEVVLLDCATFWLTNRMLADGDLAAEEAGLMAALACCPAPVVVVSNEVGLSVVPENALARRFREAQGRLNQRLAAEAALVVQVIAGLPLVLKGQLP